MEATLNHLSWVTRYKLHHLLFWAVYHYAWWSVHEGSLTAIFSTLQYTPYLIKYSAYVVFQALGVYFCLYYLIPHFLQKGRYVLFLVLTAGTVFAMAGAIYGCYHWAAWVANKEVAAFFQVEYQGKFFLFKNQAMGSCLASMTLGMSIKLAKNWIESQQRQQELEREKLETELKFLKSQFNPHFLFNTINSIFVLINKNSKQASESLAKFSGLLRYQLYECNESQIPLNRELAYLESFIELEKLRLDDNFEVKVNMLPDYKGSLSIAPFLLMPFVENAFKHISQGKAQLNWIKIDMTLNDEALTFEVANSCSGNGARNAVDYSGLGLKNVRRRLELLYPEHHQLTIKPTEGVHHISLTLNLKEQPVTALLPTES